MANINQILFADEIFSISGKVFFCKYRCNCDWHGCTATHLVMMDVTSEAVRAWLSLNYFLPLGVIAMSNRCSMMGWRVSTYCDWSFSLALQPWTLNNALLVFLQQNDLQLKLPHQVWYYLIYPAIHQTDNPVVENMYSNMPVLSLEPHTLSDDVNNVEPGIWWETEGAI